jgi:ABC-type lipoprotein release transport system permease subunit
MAWRNLWRHHQRTRLLVLVVAYAAVATVLFWGVQDGFNQSILSGNARYLAAPALIFASAYADDPDPANGLPSLDFLKPVRVVPGVRTATPRLEFSVLLRSAYTAQAAQARGVDPALEGQVSNIPAHITLGRMLERPSEVVLGKDLAARLDVRLGERVVLDASALSGQQSVGLRLVGLVDSGLAPVDAGTVLVDISQARALTGLKTATQVALDIPRGEESRVAGAVQAALPPGVRIADVSQLLGALSQTVNQKRATIFVIGLIFAIFAALAVTSTVLVSVLERTREFGVMGALGMSPLRLAQMVTLEAVIATTIGWAVGLVIGYGLNAWMANVNVLGPLFASYGGAFQTLGTGNEIYTAQNPIYALYASATIVLSALFAILIPARRLLRLEPAGALRAEA